MNDQDLLLKAICENPACDTTRLAYADWLEENGRGDRAGLVRKMVRNPWAWFVRERGSDYWRRRRSKHFFPPDEMLPEDWQALNDFLSEDLPRPFAVRRGFVASIGAGVDEIFRESFFDAMLRHPVEEFTFGNCSGRFFQPDATYPMWRAVLRYARPGAGQPSEMELRDASTRKAIVGMVKGFARSIEEYRRTHEDFT